MKICIHTLGCKVNAYESECIEETFVKNGYEVTHKNEDADVIVVNTCTVTNQADAKSRKSIRQARRDNENACVVVCGCSSEQHKDSVFDLGANIILGTDGKSKIYSLSSKDIILPSLTLKFKSVREIIFCSLLDRSSNTTLSSSIRSTTYFI